MGKNVGRSKEKSIRTKCCCRQAVESDRNLVFKILRKYQINLKEKDIDFNKDIFLLDDDNLRVAHFSKFVYKHYKLCSVSKLPQARGKKNITFLYDAVAYMFLYTDAIVIDTFIYKKNRQSIFAARINPGWEIISSDADDLIGFRWKIGDCYDHVSPDMQKLFLEKMMRTFENEFRNSLL